MGGDKRGKQKFHERAGTLHSLLYRAVLAPWLHNLRLLGAPTQHPTVLKCFWKEGAESTSSPVQGAGHFQKTTYTFLAGFSGLCSWSKTIYQASCDESSDIFPAVRINLCSSPCNVWPQAARFHLAVVIGLSRVGHPDEFPPNVVLHQCNDMMLLKYRQIKPKARRSYSPGTIHMNKQDKAWEEKRRKWFYLQLDHTSSKSN